MLVTGASGFIGSHLSRRLEREGAEVHGVSRRDRREDNLPVRWWKGDLADIDFVENTVAAVRPDIVFHLASRVTGSRSLEQVLPTFRSNLLSTVNLLGATTVSGCDRFVLAGSLEEPRGEGETAVPCSPYAAAKWSAAGYGRMFHSLYDLPFVSLKLFMVYGPGQSDHEKLIPYTILSLLDDESPGISSGERPVDWIYIDDVVEGVVRGATVPGLEGKSVDLGSGRMTTVREVVFMLDELIDSQASPRFGARPDRQEEQVRVADVADTDEKLGWRPETPLREGLRRTIAWYVERCAS